MIEINKFNLNTPILGTEDITIKDFWQWAYSDVMSNRNRSILGEFLVASALDITNTPRIEWDYYDLKYKDLKIEVKTSAYVQSWHQNKLSTISFDISKKKAWYPETNTYSEKADRYSDVYIFCLYKNTDKTMTNILDVSNWEFYVVPVSFISEKFNDQKSLRLKKLQSLTTAINYNDLKRNLNTFIENQNL
ncbi:MAG: hypothetical protein AB7V50_09435 [Vampirovibrionia bacterium]